MQAGADDGADGRVARHVAFPTGTPSPAAERDVRVAVVHDYLTQRGGAERVVLALLAAFPEARLITSVYNPSTTFPQFADHHVEQLWTGRVRSFRDDPRRAFPVLAATFSRAPAVEADVVICSSSGWAHGIRTRAPKVVYCHNPARWLYQPEDYLAGVPQAVRPVARALSRPLKAWDARQARKATTYVANSTSVQRRIRAAYGIEAEVVYPPAGIEPAGPSEPVDGIQPGYLLHVGRPRPYKNADAVCRALVQMHDERLVSVGGLPPAPDGGWPARFLGVTSLNDAQLRWLYQNCSGLIALSHEDFGLTPVEAYAFGKPVVVLRAGGYLDSTAEGISGVFAANLSVASVSDAVRRLRTGHFDPDAIRRHGAAFQQDAFVAAMRTVVRRALDESGSR